MKHNLIALAVAAAFLTPMAANAAPKVYGKLNLSVESYKKDLDASANDEEYTRLMSNASRFGLKGEDELTADLSAVYQIEWGIDADQGLDTVDASGKVTNIEKITQRNRYVGIKSQQFGTVKIGKYDTYTKLAQGEIDLFNDFAGDMAFTIAGENRINNVIGYESPKFMDTQINVMTQTQDTVSTQAKPSKIKNGSSVSVVHQNEEMGLFVALASDFGIDGDTALFAKRESNTIRLVGSYKIADLTLNALYSMSSAVVDTKRTDGKMYDDAETAYLIGAAYKLNDIVLKAQYSMAEADDTAGLAKTASTERTLMSVGADYNFASKTKAFVWYTTKEDSKVDAVNNIDETILAVGLEHKF
ncbi:MAG TPA: porin [Agitococcus sp.]|nr:porin [Agitococcus sp.]